MEKNARYLARGAVAIAEFLGPNHHPVSPELAQERADVCAVCPLNRPAKGWIDTISTGAAKATAEYFKIKQRLNLHVTGEEHLGICDACWCPIKLKVHMPVDHIVMYTDEETIAELDRLCWILNEMP